MRVRLSLPQPFRIFIFLQLSKFKTAASRTTNYSSAKATIPSKKNRAETRRCIQYNRQCLGGRASPWTPPPAKRLQPKQRSHPTICS
mmetsp:Transcript_17456/g.36831  ORF Transcript_17456/g.36831 Transcript_17456/m.36831 type:complete len:87 (-) Transcript_17456:747-1007(-)